jgi:hypothetical protein
MQFVLAIICQIGLPILFFSTSPTGLCFGDDVKVHVKQQFASCKVIYVGSVSLPMLPVFDPFLIVAHVCLHADNTE